MGIFSGFTSLVGQGLGYVSGRLSVLIDNVTIRVNDSGQLYSVGGGGGSNTAPFNFADASPFVDSNGNIYYDGGLVLANNSQINYSTGATLADSMGNLKYADSFGSNIATPNGTLYYAGLSNPKLADSNGILWYSYGYPLADAGGRLYWGSVQPGQGYTSGSVLGDGSGHLFGCTTVPLPTVAGGTGVTASITGTDTALTLTLVVTPSASGVLATVTFGSAWASTPNASGLLPLNAASAPVLSAVYASTINTTEFVLSGTLAAGTYKLSLVFIG